MRRIGVCMEGALQAATSSGSGIFKCWEVAMKLKSQGQWHECPSPTGQDKLHKLFLCPFSPISSVFNRCFRPGYLCLNTLCLCHCLEMPKCCCFSACLQGRFSSASPKQYTLFVRVAASVS